jgi:hypothetical protein
LSWKSARQWKDGIELWWTHSFGFFAEITQFADEHVDEDTEVVRVEVFLCPRRREEEVQDLEDEERYAKRIGSVICVRRQYRTNPHIRPWTH